MDQILTFECRFLLALLGLSRLTTKDSFTFVLFPADRMGQLLTFALSFLPSFFFNYLFCLWNIKNYIRKPNLSFYWHFIVYPIYIYTWYLRSFPRMHEKGTQPTKKRKKRVSVVSLPGSYLTQSRSDDTDAPQLRSLILVWLILFEALTCYVFKSVSFNYG